MSALCYDPLLMSSNSLDDHIDAIHNQNDFEAFLSKQARLRNHGKDPEEKKTKPQLDPLREIEEAVRHYRSNYSRSFLQYRELSEKALRGRSSYLHERVGRWMNALKKITEGKALYLEQDERYALLDREKVQGDLEEATGKVQSFLLDGLLDASAHDALIDKLDQASRDYPSVYNALKRNNLMNLLSGRSRK